MTKKEIRKETEIKVKERNFMEIEDWKESNGHKWKDNKWKENQERYERKINKQWGWYERT